MPRPRKRPIRRPGLTSTPASNASRSATTSSATVWNSPPLRWVCPASANSSQPRSAGRYGWRRGDGRQADDDQEADYYAHPAGTALGSLLGVLPGAGKFTSAASTSMTTSLGQEAGHRSRQLRASRPAEVSHENRFHMLRPWRPPVTFGPTSSDSMRIKRLRRTLQYACWRLPEGK
jgi:hypothetical protein